MFNAKSDYAYNKKNLAAIVYQTAGGPIMLTRSDFDSDEEFQRWKDWSDQNYRETERQNRPSDDHLALEEYIEAAAVLLNSMDEANQCNTQDQKLDLQRFRSPESGHGNPNARTVRGIMVLSHDSPRTCGRTLGRSVSGVPEL